MNTVATVYLPVEMKQALEEFSRATERSTSYHVRQALKAYLANTETPIQDESLLERLDNQVTA